MFAVVTISGKQYKVSKGDVILVERLEEKVGDTITIPEVLLVSDEGKTKVGKPAIKGIAVKAKVLGQEKGEKINVRRFKSKVRYRKSTGFRPQFTKLEILSIG